MNQNKNDIEKMVERLIKDFILAEVMLALFALVGSIMSPGGIRGILYIWLLFNIPAIPTAMIQIVRIIELKSIHTKITTGEIRRNFVSKPKGIVSYHAFHFVGKFRRHRDVLNKYSELKEGTVKMKHTKLTKLIVGMEILPSKSFENIT